MNIVRRVARRMVARTVRKSGHPGRLIAGFIIALGVLIAVASLNLLPPLAIGSPMSGSGFRLAATNEPSATATYLKGQQTFDARLVWESYSDRVIQDLRQRGGTVEDTQRQLDRVRQMGTHIDQVKYIGGYPLQTGSMQFYVVTRAGTCPADAPQAARPHSGLVSNLAQTTCDAVSIPYVFTLDDKGKIDRVE
jgi:hypothetical protein